METPETNPYTVSSETALFIKCIEQLGKLYGCVYDALTNLYGEKAALELINGNFFKEYVQLEKTVEGFLGECIMLKVDEIDNNEI